MNSVGWLQLLLLAAGLLIITKPLGIYLLKVLDPDQGGRTFLEPILGSVERLIYTICQVDRRRQQNWKQYAVAMLVFSAVGMLLTYGLLRLQDKLPLNPQNLPAVPDTLAFNTAASFTANTCWQSYGGEGTMSYFSQMVALASQNFMSSAVGLAVCAGLVRGIARRSSREIGNFWVDITRVCLYLFIPVCILYALYFVASGSPQNFHAYTAAGVVDQSAAASTTQPVVQNIVQGPIASLAAIKMFGVDGDGYVNANAAHPFENCSPLSDFIMVVAFLSVGFSLTYYLGRMVKNQRHGWACWAVIASLMFTSMIGLWYFEAQPNPRLAEMGISPLNANMEGKEVRFGIFRSAEFGAGTTAAGCGAVNSMHDSYTPMGGFIPLFNQHLGEIIPGGIGSGLCGFLVYVFVAVFIAGLMIGRTPEYLGKKIDAYDVKLAALYLLAPVFACLAFTGWAAISDWGIAGLNNNGPHGFSELLYAYTSASANNGSAFGGLTCTPANGDRHYNATMAIAILVGRYFQLVPILALAGALALKKPTPASAGSFPVTGFTFGLLVACVILIVGALNFLPSLALGPIVEHFIMRGSALTY